MSKRAYDYVTSVDAVFVGPHSPNIMHELTGKKAMLNVMDIIYR